jgi:hypothetical protein
MKDSKFIELLNLYVDHQISVEDAALLEAEIQRSPERRRIYREYCQMQKACVVLAETFRTQAPAGGKIAEARRKGRSRLAFATYTMGTLAAAACVALVFVERNRFSQTNTNTVNVHAPANLDASVASTVPTPAPAAVRVMAPAPIATPAAERPALQPAFAGLVRTDAAGHNSLVASVPLDWMNRVQLQRVPAQELWFESRPSAQPNELIFRNARPADQQTSLAAFRFQR